MFHFIKSKYCPKPFSQDCRVSRYFTKANSRKGSKQVENSKKMVIFVIVCCHGNSLQYTHMNENGIPGCIANLHCECQELKPKVEANTSFLVRHPFSVVDTVKTVESHLKVFQTRYM